MSIDYEKLQSGLKSAIEKDNAEHDFTKKTAKREFFREVIKMLGGECADEDVIKTSRLLENDYTFGYTIKNELFSERNIWLVGFNGIEEWKIFKIGQNGLSPNLFKVNNNNDFKTNKNAVDEPDKRGIKIPLREKDGKLTEQLAQIIDFKTFLWKTIDFTNKRIIDNRKY